MFSSIASGISQSSSVGIYGFRNYGYPKSSIFLGGMFHCKPSSWGTPMDTSICWYLNGTEEKFAPRYQLRCALHASEFLKLTKPLNLEVPHGFPRIPTDSHGAPGGSKRDQRYFRDGWIQLNSLVRQSGLVGVSGLQHSQTIVIYQILPCWTSYFMDYRWLQLIYIHYILHNWRASGMPWQVRTDKVYDWFRYVGYVRWAKHLASTWLPGDRSSWLYINDIIFIAIHIYIYVYIYIIYIYTNIYIYTYMWSYVCYH